MVKPSALIIYPPVCDFALFDLYFKSFALFNLKDILEKNGWEGFTLEELNSLKKLSHI